MAVTLTLEDEIDVSRGDMLVRPNNVPRVDHDLDAMVVWMAEEALRPHRPYWIKHTTGLTAGTISALRYRISVDTLQRQPADTLEMNEVGRLVVTVSRPLSFDAYRQNRATGAFIIVDRMTNGTVGAGMIVDRGHAPGFLSDQWQDDTLAAARALQSSLVTGEERSARLGHAPLTILITGLNGTGKTTLAYALERRLFDIGLSASVLDGRQARHNISKGLGFTSAERSENLRRGMDVARYLNEAGLVCICAFVAPSAVVRERARQAIGPERFIEIHVHADESVRRSRDTEGMYAKADTGEIPDFPGVSAPYDVPAHADVSLDTGTLSIGECVDRIVAVVRDRLES
jgi:bifunctional enzyme CysN/CysC